MRSRLLRTQARSLQWYQSSIHTGDPIKRTVSTSRWVRCLLLRGFALVGRFARSGIYVMCMEFQEILYVQSSDVLERMKLERFVRLSIMTRESTCSARMISDDRALQYYCRRCTYIVFHTRPGWRPCSTSIVNVLNAFERRPFPAAFNKLLLQVHRDRDDTAAGKRRAY